MRVDWLDDLIALLDAGGVAEAARRRNVTQPAFSRRVQALEQVLGFDLIDRSVKPSGPSTVLQAHAVPLRKLAASQRMLLSEMRSEQLSGARQVVLACQHAISTSLGPSIVKTLTVPGETHIRLRSANRDECETLLLSRQAAIALTYRIAFDPPGDASDIMTESVIGRDTLVPVVGKPWANDVMWRVHQGELRLIGYPAEVFLGAALADHVLPQLEGRCRPVLISETGLTTAALELALAGLGVAWVPKALADPALTRGDLINLYDDLGGLELDIVARGWIGSPNRSVADTWARLTRDHLDPPD